MADKTETREYSAVFTLELPAGSSEEDWAEALALLDDHFANQWRQTYGSGNAWAVTIHADDRID